MSKGESLSNLFAIAERFKPGGEVIDVREFGSGNINTTFLVTLDREQNSHFILQRVNTQVFRMPEHVMHNMRIVTEHIRDRLRRSVSRQLPAWQVPSVLLTHDGRDHWSGPDGSFWRAISFIEGARSFETVRDIHHANEVGYSLGRFHALISDLPFEKLFDTLEGFHIAPQYLRHYDRVISEYKNPLSAELRHCLQFVTTRRELTQFIEIEKELGKLLLRPIHGDPKVDNVLIDNSTGRAAGIVDLDTVKPGLVHYDIGDCLRSSCNPLGEEKGWQDVSFDINLCRAVLQGYMSEAREILTENDFDYVYDAIRLIAFELGLRFLTDYLEGDVYFKVSRPEHNLARALVQFKLTESIESQEAAIRKIIQSLK